MTKPMGMESTSTKRSTAKENWWLCQDMKESGKMTSIMGVARKIGQTIVHTLECTQWGRKTESVPTCGQTATPSRGTGPTTRSHLGTASTRESISGPTGKATLASGTTIWWTGRAPTSGSTGEFTKELTAMIRNTASESTFMLTGELTLGLGLTETRILIGFTSCLMGQSERESGKVLRSLKRIRIWVRKKSKNRLISLTKLKLKFKVQALLRSKLKAWLGKNL